MNNIITNITSDQLREAAAIKDQISHLEADLAAILVGVGKSSASAAPAVAARGKKRGRKPGSRSMAPSALSAQPAIKKAAKRKMSPEGRARIIAAQKARWAKVRAGK